MTALHFRPLAEIVADMATGALSSEAVTAHTLARIEALEPRLHAFAEVRAEAALAEARAADLRRAAGAPLGPLHGAPVAIKDLLALAGTRTRAGGFFDTGFAADATATVATRLQDAGAIIVGKLQLTEGAWGSHHPAITAPVNPWAEDYWTGVSSSGSGVAAAAGLAYGTIGTDTAGSIRFPSACCHVVGLKPTWGRVSRHGVFPLSDTFDHVGPMARSTLDVALMFAAIAGPDPRDPTALDGPRADWVSAARAGRLDGVRIGLDTDYAMTGLDEPTSAALKGAIGALREAGATIVEVTMPPVAAILEKAFRAAFVEAAISHARTYPSQRAAYSDAYAALLDAGRAASGTDYAEVAIWRREYRGRLSAMFREAEMIIAPVVPIAPPTVAQMALATGGPPEGAATLTAYTIPFNLAGVPSLTLPMGLAPSGAPLGFQLIGPDLAEAVLLSAGAAYERVTGFSGRHPPV